MIHVARDEERRERFVVRLTREGERLESLPHDAARACQAFAWLVRRLRRGTPAQPEGGR